jgi:5-oxoprolinase (ATP-hydrolysing) subunit A
MNVVDLNSDMGESFGLYNYGADEEIIRFISSSNIACGFHAGDPSVIRKSVRLACKHGVAIGAHFGFPDLLGFGRRNLQVEPAELKDYLTYQLGALQAFVKAEGVQLHHVKPHGALYMMALENEEMSHAIVEAVLQQNSNLALYTMEGSATFYIAKKLGLKTISEFFADRGYRSDGTVKMFHWNIAEAGGTPQAIGDRIARLFTTGKIASIDGREIEVRAETVCIHSDTPGAPEIARAIRSALERAGIKVQAP